jgi:phosphohistidine phosphatase
MRRLLLLRHAKSSWAEAGMADIDRPLAPRGIEAAPRMAAHMAERGYLPDLAVVSAARRTRETWALLAPTFPAARVLVEPRIYEAPPGALLDIIAQADDAAGTLLLVGHNPGLQLVALHLAARERTVHRRALEQKFPTAALVAIDFDAESWAALRPDTGRLVAFDTPRSIGAADVDD